MEEKLDEKGWGWKQNLWGWCSFMFCTCSKHTRPIMSTVVDNIHKMLAANYCYTIPRINTWLRIFCSSYASISPSSPARFRNASLPSSSACNTLAVTLYAEVLCSSTSTKVNKKHNIAQKVERDCFSNCQSSVQLHPQARCSLDQR